MDLNLNTELLRRLATGDHKAFDRLFLMYYPKVKNFIFGFIKQEEDASDMSQELFYKVWLNREKVGQVSSINAYLFRMARNMIYDYYEHSLVVETHLQKEKSKDSYTDLIEERIYAKELELLINIAVEQMPEQRKRIFRMSRQEGLNNEEISIQLGIQKRTVENHLTQALADLRKVIHKALLLFL